MELTWENHRDEIARVEVELEYREETGNIPSLRVLTARPVGPIPAEMLAEDARLRVLGYYECDTSAPMNSVYHLAMFHEKLLDFSNPSKGFPVVAKRALLVLQRRGFVLKRIPDYEI